MEIQENLEDHAKAAIRGMNSYEKAGKWDLSLLLFDDLKENPIGMWRQSTSSMAICQPSPGLTSASACLPRDHQLLCCEPLLRFGVRVATRSANGQQSIRQESWENAYVSGYTLDKQTLAGFDEKDIPFLENLVEKCIEDSVADVKCIHRGSQGRWKFAWRNKMWSVGSHNSEVSESIKDIEFHRSAMRAYFKDSGPKKMDVFITSH
eukprot:s645_g33.t1